MFSAEILKIRKQDENFLQNFIFDTEIKYNKKKKNFINTINVKTAIAKICCLNKQLKIFSKELKSNLSDDNWNKIFSFCKKYKEEMKQLLKITQRNKIELVKNLLNRKNKLRRKKEKNKQWILKRAHLDKIKNRLKANINNWMKLKQNEIDREKEKQVLHKNADIVLSDVRANRIDAKKFLIILKELDNLRKVKVTIARAKGELITLEADKVFNNIIVKLMQQWKRLDREYFLEEKGLNLMIKTGNEQQILKRTTNLCKDWELILFKKKIFSNIKKSKNYITLRSLWDVYININEGSGIPVGWVIPFETTYPWKKCS